MEQDKTNEEAALGVRVSKTVHDVGTHLESALDALVLLMKQMEGTVPFPIGARVAQLWIALNARSDQLGMVLKSIDKMGDEPLDTAWAYEVVSDRPIAVRLGDKEGAAHDTEAQLEANHDRDRPVQGGGTGG